MPNLQKYNIRLQSNKNLNLVSAYFKDDEFEGRTIELIISIEPNNINIKELSSYLDFIYRLDGQLSEIGYLHYVHYPHAQIEIDEIRFGSWQIIIQKAINSFDADKLIIIFLCLKYLPVVVQSFLGSVKNVYEILNAREDYLEKKEKRKLRKNIRNLINDELEFSNLNKRQKDKLIDIMEQLYYKNSKRAVPSSRFANKYIKEIKLFKHKN
ncbi:MAG: hypothetical protein ACTHJ0_04235 [Flavipsychrobacter sp.]